MDNNMESVPYTVFESVQARADRKFRLMWALLILMLIALVGTNAGWIIYESQFEDVITVSQDVDTQSSPAYVNGTGSMTVNGESEADNN